MARRRRRLGDADIRVRRAKHPDLEYHVEHWQGMRRVVVMHRPSGMPVTRAGHALSVGNAAEYMCLADQAFVGVKNIASDDGYRGVERLNACFARQPECPASMLAKCKRR